jgi:hypothetical protein
MARSATLAVAAFIGVLLAGCSGGTLGQAGVLLPGADGVQTVSDAADALDAHRSSGSETAKAAIGAADALGSFVREVANEERALDGSGRGTTSYIRGKSAALTVHTEAPKISEVSLRGIGRIRSGFALRTSSKLVTAGGKGVISSAELVMRPSLGSLTDYCQSVAGFSVTGIPSLDETFGWQNDAFSGGARATDDRGFATWMGNASGEVLQAAIGGLSIVRGAASPTCPMTEPAFALNGSAAKDAFSIPISVTFRRGQLWSLSVSNAKFSNGESLEATSENNRQGVSVSGVITNERSQMATFRTDAGGDGTLTITSTGAQYVIANWVVVST